MKLSKSLYWSFTADIFFVPDESESSVDQGDSELLEADKRGRIMRQVVWDSIEYKGEPQKYNTMVNTNVVFAVVYSVKI